MGIFEKAAEKILSCPRMKQIYSEQVQRQLRFLHPTRDREENCREFYKEKISLMLKIMAIGAFLIPVILYFYQTNEVLKDGYLVQRENEGAADGEIRLRVQTQQEEIPFYDFSYVPEKEKYTPAEIEQHTERFVEECDGLILGENESTEEVRYNLNLKESYDTYPMEFEWMSSDHSVLDSDGTVYNEELPRARPVTLTVVITYEEIEYEHELAVCIVSKSYTEEELWKRNVLRAVQKADNEQKYEDTLILPEEINGTKVTFSEQKDRSFLFCMFLPFVAAILLYYAKDRDLNKLAEEKRKKMQLKYPEFVSKFQLLFGAGMTVRGILYKLSEDKSLGKELGEELGILVRDLKNGMSSKEALDRFGKRSGCSLYIKFSALLIQNMKKGTKDFLPMLEKEAEEAFLMRKHQAKQLGEEAGTKLLAPMILLLAMVMVMIVVPAFLSFQL